MPQIAPGAPERAGRPVAFLYLSGLVQGVVMVSFAASSAVLCSRHGFTDTEYGSIFLPQVVAAAAAALSSGTLLRVLDLRGMLALSFAAMTLSQAALAGSHFLGRGGALGAVALGTALMGLGSGLGAAPLNTYPQLLFPSKSESAVVAMHTAMGFGLAAGPAFVGATATRDLWLLFPLASGAASLGLLVAGLRAPFPRPRLRLATERGSLPASSPGFWPFVAIALLYGTAEAAYSNWAVLYLSEDKGLSIAAASFALAAFWLALSLGRVTVGLLVLRVPAERVYLALPGLMAGASLLLPYADSGPRATFVYLLAGLGCSAFYPLTVGLASRRFPGHMAWVASIAYGALVTGIGAGSFLTGALKTLLPLSTLYPAFALCPLLARLLAGRVLLPRRTAPAATGLG
jgi:MFS transporter